MSSRCVTLMCSLLLLALSHPAWAAEASSVDGVVTVDDSGTLFLDNKQIRLWGVTPLAPDQQCLREDRSWNCGEESVETLRHALANRTVHCALMGKSDGPATVAQCSFVHDGSKEDLGAFWISSGWALEATEESDGYYEEDIDDARTHRRGIWTSRFQKPEDWKNGIPRYVQYVMTPSPSVAPEDSSQLIVAPSEYLIEDSGAETETVDPQ